MFDVGHRVKLESLGARLGVVDHHEISRLLWVVHNENVMHHGLEWVLGGVQKWSFPETFDHTHVIVHESHMPMHVFHESSEVSLSPLTHPGFPGGVVAFLGDPIVLDPFDFSSPGFLIPI